MDLVEALDADSGMTCFVGAGGKKTTIFRLARELRRAVVTATVRIPIFDSHVAAVRVTDSPGGAIVNATDWPLGIVPDRDRADRYLGYSPQVLDSLSTGYETPPILVKADGARTRWLKVPAEDEPQIPSRASTVVPIASSRVVGQPLTEEHVHRVDEVGRLTGLSPGATIEPEHVVTVLASPEGGRKRVPVDASAIPLINMAAGRETIAREIACDILDGAPVERVVVAEMTASDPIVDVIS